MKESFNSSWREYGMDASQGLDHQRPTNSTINRRRQGSCTSRSPPTAGSGIIQGDIIAHPCISPLSPSEWVMGGPDYQSEDGVSAGNCFMENLHVIPISPMMENSVDESWDFDFDEGRGGTTLHTSRSSQPSKSLSIFPDLSPRSERKQASLFSPVFRQRERFNEDATGRSSHRFRGASRSRDTDHHSRSLQEKPIPRMQSARGPINRTQSSSSADQDELEVDEDSWAFKMIRHHSEPSLRPQCRQTARHFYDQNCYDNSKNAGPAHLSTGLDIASAHIAKSLRQNLRKEKSDALVLARITGRMNVRK